MFVCAHLVEAGPDPPTDSMCISCAAVSQVIFVGDCNASMISILSEDMEEIFAIILSDSPQPPLPQEPTTLLLGGVSFTSSSHK
jgi:hypothetical protein